MPDLEKALDAAMAAAPDRHLGYPGGWEPAIPRDHMRHVLEAAWPHMAAMPTSIIHVEGGEIGEATLEELAEQWKAACRNTERERIAELEQLATDIIATYHQGSDGYRGRVGQVQIKKWLAVLDGTATDA